MPYIWNNLQQNCSFLFKTRACIKCYKITHISIKYYSSIIGKRLLYELRIFGSYLAHLSCIPNWAFLITFCLATIFLFWKNSHFKSLSPAPLGQFHPILAQCILTMGFNSVQMKKTHPSSKEVTCSREMEYKNIYNIKQSSSLEPLNHCQPNLC